MMMMMAGKKTYNSVESLHSKWNSNQSIKIKWKRRCTVLRRWNTQNAQHNKQRNECASQLAKHEIQYTEWIMFISSCSAAWRKCLFYLDIIYKYAVRTFIRVGHRNVFSLSFEAFSRFLPTKHVLFQHVLGLFTFVFCFSPISCFLSDSHVLSTENANVFHFISETNSINDTRQTIIMINFPLLCISDAFSLNQFFMIFFRSNFIVTNDCIDQIIFWFYDSQR